MLRSLEEQGGAAFLIVAWVAPLLWVVTRIRYRITDRHVRVRLGTVTLRKIALSDIASVDTRLIFWNEHWCNTLWPWGRIVRIKRKSGFIRNFVVTPDNRDEFITQLRERLGRRVVEPGTSLS